MFNINNVIVNEIMSLDDFCSSSMTECAHCGTLSLTNEESNIQKPKKNIKA